jgi:hypothetical protein
MFDRSKSDLSKMDLSKKTARCAFAALITGAASLMATTSYAGPSYDGLWSVLVVTEKGDCDRGYRYPVRIENGKLANAGDTAFTISGAVAPTGTITVTVSAGSKSATGLGRLDANEGGGHWTGGTCSGSWTAERRGA